MIPTDRLARTLGCALLASVVVSIGIGVSVREHVADPFLHEHTATLALAERSSDLPDDFLWPGMMGLVLTLDAATGLTPGEIEYMPVAAALFLLGALALVSRLTGSAFLGAAAAAAVAFRFELPYLHSVWPHAIGFALFLTFAYVWIDRDALAWSGPGFGIAAFVLFFGIHLFSYSAELWAIAYMTSYAALLWYFRRSAPGAWKRPARYVGVFAVTAFGLNRVIYNAFLPRIGGAEAFDSVSAYLFRFTRALGLSPDRPMDPHVWFPDVGLALSLASKLWFLLVFVPFVALAVNAFSRGIPGLRERRPPGADLAVIALAAPFAGDFAVYASVGGASVGARYLVLVLPLVLALALRAMYQAVGTTTRTVELATRAHMTALVAVSIAVFCLFLGTPNNVLSETDYAEVDGAESFLRENVDSGQVLTDHTTGSRMAVHAAEAGHALRRTVEYGLLNDNAVEEFLGNRTARVHARSEVVAVTSTWSDQKTWVGGWRDLRPLSEYMSALDRNREFHRIYDDGDVLLYSGVLRPTFPPGR